MEIRKILPLIGLMLSFSIFAAELPQNEKTFIVIATNAVTQADKATNASQRGGVKTRRDDALCSTLSQKRVNNWVGKVSKVDADKNGKGLLAVKIAENVTLKTWSNDLSDASDKTLIDPGSKLFEKTTMLTVGDQVRFSGEFFGGDRACIKEAALNPDGSLKEPDFIFRFSEVDKI